MAALKTTTTTTTTKKSDPTPAHLPHQSTASDDADADAEAEAERWERENVHDVYSSIAPHFSATRYKPWPLVSDFLASLPPGSIGVDVGCGNGKYIHLRNLLHGQVQQPGCSQSGGPARPGSFDCLTIGLDRSEELIQFARTQSMERMAAPTRTRAKGTSKSKGKGKGKAEPGTEATSGAEGDSAAPPLAPLNEVAVGDGLTTGFRSRCFDYAISIATIHHFSTRARRRGAIQELIRLVQPVDATKAASHSHSHSHAAGGGRGRFLVYVWALEQKGQERRKFDEEREQQQEQLQKAVGSDAATGRDVLVPWVMRRRADVEEEDDEEDEEPVYQRYYHLFEEAELEALVEEAVAGLPEEMRTRRGTRRGGSAGSEPPPPSRLRVVREDSGWERGNWWGVWKVVWA